MKKSILITIALLLLYTITFLVLFIKLRSLSSAALEEIGEANIYYILGFMFISGISATFYLIMESNNKNSAISIDKDAEMVLATEEEAQTMQDSGNVNNGLAVIKSDLASIIDQKGISEAEQLEKVIWKICKHFEISQALLYFRGEKKGQHVLKTSYAFVPAEGDSKNILSGEGLTGQAVKDHTPYFIKDIPEGYLKVISGLGESLPKSLLIIPCMSGDEVSSVFELSSLHEYPQNIFNEIVEVCNYVSNLLTK